MARTRRTKRDTAAAADQSAQALRKPKNLAHARRHLRRRSAPAARPSQALVQRTRVASSALPAAPHHRARRARRARRPRYMAEEHVQHDSGPHPLQFKWTLWHDYVTGRSRSAQYAANLSRIASFDTVEDFWAVFNSLKEPSELPINHTYNLFKDGIEPKWEDPQNEDGGEWRVPFANSHAQDLDKCWINTILTVIGEGFGPQESDDIAGIVMNRKKGTNRLAIWTKTATDEDLQMRIGRRWRETSGIKSDQNFLLFKDSIMTKKSRPRYVIS